MFLGYQQFENNVIQPAVVGSAVNLTPPATMLAALVGGAAAGVPGALVATPLIGAAKALYLERRGQLPPQQEPALTRRAQGRGSAKAEGAGRRASPTRGRRRRRGRQGPGSACPAGVSEGQLDRTVVPCAGRAVERDGAAVGPHRGLDDGQAEAAAAAGGGWRDASAR